MVIAQCALSQMVQFPGLNVVRKLPIPNLGVVFSKPIAERSKLVNGKLLDLALDLLEVAHEISIPFLSSAAFAVY
jgi:hypothetical protein